jgi:two-component system response regulator AlgR
LFPLADVICLNAEDKYTIVVHKSGKLVIDQSLLELEKEHADVLVRVHRGTLVAKKCIRGLEKSAQGRHFLQLEGCEDRPQVSRRNLPAVRKLIRKLT